jgi:hypothetical protein
LLSSQKYRILRNEISVCRIVRSATARNLSPHHHRVFCANWPLESLQPTLPLSLVTVVQVEMLAATHNVIDCHSRIGQPSPVIREGDMLTGKLLVFASILTVIGVSDCLAAVRCSAITRTITYHRPCGVPNGPSEYTPWITNQPVIIIGESGTVRCRGNDWVEVRDGSWVTSFRPGWVKRNLLSCEGSFF